MKVEIIQTGEIQKIQLENPLNFRPIIEELICNDIDFQYHVERQFGECESYLYVYCKREELTSILSGIQLIDE